MKLFTLAIASIVDVNTGHGLSGSHRVIDSNSAIDHGLAIRSRSVGGVFSALKSALARRLRGFRARARERRDLRRLMSMNDRLLKDIGITRGDLMAVEMGAASLADLNAERQAAQRSADVGTGPAVATRKLAVTGNAANQQSYVEKKCA